MLKNYKSYLRVGVGLWRWENAKDFIKFFTLTCNFFKILTKGRLREHNTVNEFFLVAFLPYRDRSITNIFSLL